MLAVAIGLKLSDVSPLDTSGGGLQLGNSILFWALSYAMLGVDPNSVNVDLHPVAFAGWIGLLVTTLNLLPVGQLDGGHVVYALFGRWHRTIARLFIVACVLMVVVPLRWARLLGRMAFLGGVPVLPRPGASGHRRCGYAARSAAQRFCAWATIVLFIVTFSPVPLHWYAEGDIRTPQEQPRQDKILPASFYRFETPPPNLPAVRCGSKDSEMSGAGKRPSWDQYFMTITRQVAERSTCLRAKVGAVIVRDRSILATGYNGSPAGLAALHRRRLPDLRVAHARRRNRAELLPHHPRRD